MDIQIRWNLMAERNRNNIDIPELNVPGKLYKMAISGTNIYCYLSSNFTSVSIYFNDVNNFTLPQFANSKLEQKGNQQDGIITEYYITLPNDKELIFTLKHFENIHKRLVVLVKDETYDYRNTMTNSFYTRPQINTILQREDFPIKTARPIQIYFCFDPDAFIIKYNSIITDFEPKDIRDFNQLKVNFPNKDEYFDHYKFNVIEKIIPSPNLTEHKFLQLLQPPKQEPTRLRDVEIMNTQHKHKSNTTKRLEQEMELEPYSEEQLTTETLEPIEPLPLPNVPVLQQQAPAHSLHQRLEQQIQQQQQEPIARLPKNIRK